MMAVKAGKRRRTIATAFDLTCSDPNSVEVVSSCSISISAKTTTKKPPGKLRIAMLCTFTHPRYASLSRGERRVL